MLFYEYAITPQVFDKEYIEKDISLQIYLKFFLTSLRKNGLLANMNNNEWFKKVNEYRTTLSPKLRDELSKIFEELSKRNRIVDHRTLVESSISEEMDWIDLALKEDKLKPYKALLFTGSIEEKHKKMITLEKCINDDVLQDEDTPLLYQTLESMEKYLTDFLVYAKRLIIIDPYFTFGEEDATVLLLLSELFARRRGNRMKDRKIIINIFYNTKDWNIKPDSEEYQHKWIMLFQTIYEKYGHMVTLNIWNDKNMHDRFMLTDQGGISSSNGFSVYRSRKPHWSILKHDEIREQLNYFLPNANARMKNKLIYSLTKDTVMNVEPKVIVQNGLNGIIKTIENTPRGKEGIIRCNEDEYHFAISKLNNLSKEIGRGTDVEFRLKITGSEKIADIVKILN